jgi:lipooligosaccharide transport system permease protein
MAAPLTLRVVEGHARAYRHTWRGTTISAVVTPILFLAAMGLGLGSLVDTGRSPEALGGVTYLAWLAPGLMAAGAMQNGAADGSFPVMYGMRWLRTYHAAMASPVRPRDLMLGNLVWAALRATVAGTSFVVIASLFGAMTLGRGFLALAPAVFTGAAFCAAVSGFTATRQTDQALSGLFRFVVMPLFLFSGTFFPIEQLPDAVQPVAYVIPLWHGVELTRALALGTSPALAWPIHLAVVAALLVVGATIAARIFDRRLAP